MTAGLVLAAGEGARFGRPKAPVAIDGERMVDRSVRILLEGGCHRVVVVLGAWVGSVPGCEVIHNAAWREGLGSSLRTGLRALRHQQDASDVVITLVDLPGMTGAAVRRVAEHESGIVVATYAGQRGHPVKIAREHWCAVTAAARGEEGARPFLRGRADIAFVEVGDVALGHDVDLEPGEGAVRLTP